MFTFDRRTIDSSGAFLVGELERLDKTLHAPLSSVTWGRDIDLREDVTIADESSSFTLSNYAASGNPKATFWHVIVSPRATSRIVIVFWPWRELDVV